MSKKKKGSADPNEEIVETKKAKKEKKAKKAKKEKTPMDIDSKKTLAKSITALACVIAICVTAVVNTGKMCDAVKKASEQKGDSSISDTSGDDVIDNGDNGEVPTDANGEVPTDANGETPTEADGGEVTTAADSGNSSSGNNSSSTAKTTANSGSSIPTGVAQIVNYYNTATAKVASKKAAFSKTRTTTEKSYESGAALKASKSIVYKFMGVGDENKFSKNITAAEANEYNKYFKASKLTTSDVTSATCTKSGSNYTITLKIKDGSSSVKGGKVVSSNNSPLDRSGLACGDNDKDYWDHKTAENVMSAISEVPLCGSANINESYSGAVITAVVNASNGNLVSLNAKFDFKFELSSVMGSSGTAAASSVVNMTGFKM